MENSENNQLKPKASVYFVSLGCPKNLVDSEVMLGKLEREKYQLTQTPENAEVIIVNTCSFIDASKEESVDTILEMAAYKDSGQCKVLVASGCMAQRYAQKLEKELPEVDLFIGTGQYQRITEILESHEEALRLGSALPNRSYVDQPAFIHTENDERIHTGPAHSAFLKLSEGCNRRCAFCIIPFLRGNVRSRTVESLVKEAEAYAKRGVKELNLVAQDLTEYGMEWKYRERLETLLPELCKIEGIEWIRLHYVYPDQFSDELLEIVATQPKIVKYLDMPIQHTSNTVLERMNRRLTRDKLFSLVNKLRSRIPNLVIRTSIIVGFPGETEEDFNLLCQDLETLQLDHVGVFSYSREEGTPAAKMENQVHPSTRRKRRRKLIELLQNQRLEKQKAWIGKRAVAIFEGPSKDSDLLLQVRLSTQAQEIDGCVLVGESDIPMESLKIGTLVEVEILEGHPVDFVGRIISHATNTRSQTNTLPGLSSVLSVNPLTSLVSEV